MRSSDDAVLTTSEVLTIAFKRRDPELTRDHVVELRVAGAPPIHFTRDEARALCQRVSAFLQGTR